MPLLFIVLPILAILLAIFLAIFCGNPVSLWLIHLIGFGSGGIGAGSWGAWLMSVLSPTQAGSLVAMLQSMGALGAGAGPWACIVIIPVCIILLCLRCCI